MRIRKRRMRDHFAVLKEVVCCRNVVTGFIPEIGKAQQRRMQQKDGCEDQRKNLQSTDARKPHGRSSRSHLVHRTTCSCHVGIQLDLAEGLLILRNVLSQNMEQRLGLLWTQVDPLKVGDLNLFGCLLAQSAKCKKKVPDAHAHLDTIGVTFAILRGVY